MRTYTEEY